MKKIDIVLNNKKDISFEVEEFTFKNGFMVFATGAVENYIALPQIALMTITTTTDESTECKCDCKCKEGESVK